MNKAASPLEVRNLTVFLRYKPVLWDINLTFPSGQLSAIIGPNGAGKTTLLKAIMGIVPSEGGKVLFWGGPLDGVRNQVAYVPQRQSVDWNFPVCVFEVAMMGRYGHMGLFKRESRQDKAIVTKALTEVGLESMAERQIGELSGGEQQRLFLARALAQEANLYLLDEPFAGVDVATEAIILKGLKRLTDQGKGVIMIHHSLVSVKKYSDYVALINGRLHAVGNANKVINSANLAAAYGSTPTLFSQLCHLIHQKQLPCLE